MNFRHFFDHLNDPFDNLWNLNNFFNNFFYWHNFLHNCGNNLFNFQRNIDNSFHLDNFLDFNYSLDYFFDGHNLWDFDYFLDNFLDYLFDFDHFGDHPEDLENVIDIDNIHDFLLDHSNNSLVDFQCHIHLLPDLVQLLQQGFQKYSQVELDFAWFLWTVGIDILDLDNLRDVLDYFYQSVHLVHFHQVDQLLLEEFGQMGVHFL